MGTGSTTIAYCVSRSDAVLTGTPLNSGLLLAGQHKQQHLTGAERPNRVR